jgi:hypothetical protein
MGGASIVSIMSVVDPLTPLMTGLGLAGAALAAPRLAAGRDAGRRLGCPVEVIAAVLGAAVFAAAAVANPPAALESLAAFPVLVAAPVAFGSVRVLRTTRGEARRAAR